MLTLITGSELVGVSRAVHSAVVRIGVAGSLLAMFTFGVSWLFSRDTAVLVQGAAPLATSILYGIQVLTKRENAIVALTTGALVIVATFGLVGTHETSVATMLALWVLAVAACFFVVRWAMGLIAGCAFGLAVLPSLWSGRFDAPLAIGLVMSVSFVIMANLVIAVRISSARSESRFRRLFTAAPVALLEQEWGDVVSYLASIGVETESELRATLEDLDVLADVIGRVRVLRMNPKARAIMGIGPHENLELLPRNRVHPTSAESLRQQVVAIWQGKPRFEVEYLTHPEGEPEQDTWVRVEVVSTEISEHSKRIVIAVTDITQLKEAQNTLEGLVRSKDEFIASVSHELRTPLTGVMGLSATLLDGYIESEEERRSLLMMVVQQSKELSYLVEDLLVGARADIGTIAIRPQRLDLAAEVESVIEGIDLSVSIDATSAPVWADPVRVRQVIRNLVVNAGRYGGSEMRATVYERDGLSIFEMFDSGDPIPVASRDRIFEPYGRAHMEAGTTASVGLGLAVSQQLADLMSGSLEYLYDRGSIFRFTLPTSGRPASNPNPVIAQQSTGDDAEAETPDRLKISHPVADTGS